MGEPPAVALFLAKAQQALRGAERESGQRAYDNCVNRCYYACFLSAIAALMRAGIQPMAGDRWQHRFVQSQFVGQLMHRRKLYPADLRRVLLDTYRLREQADYKAEAVNERQAGRALRSARSFVVAVREGSDTR